jgi:hypothetical protein
MAGSWTVTCEDGIVRHAEPFTSYRDAQEWAWWGHLCTTPHTIARGDEVSVDLPSWDQTT